MPRDVAATSRARPGSRRPGRPRDARADDVIREAAAEVLAECGPGGFTVDAVAAKAGVGKATIYRRWSSRAELLLETAHLATPDIEDPDTGSLRDDLIQLTTGIMFKMRDSAAGRMLPAVMAEAAVNPEMRETLTRFVQHRRSRAIQAVLRGIERGELRRDINPELVVDLLAGPVFVRTMLSHQPIDENLVEAAVDVIIAGAS